MHWAASPGAATGRPGHHAPASWHTGCSALTGNDGTLDDRFGTGGLSAVGVTGGSISGLVAQGDGRWVASGGLESKALNDGFVMRITADGALDPAFGPTGQGVTFLASDNDWLYAVDVDPSARIVAAGARVDEASQKPTVVRLW